MLWTLRGVKQGTIDLLEQYAIKQRNAMGFIACWPGHPEGLRICMQTEPFQYIFRKQLVLPGQGHPLVFRKYCKVRELTSKFFAIHNSQSSAYPMRGDVYYYLAWTEGTCRGSGESFADEETQRVKFFIETILQLDKTTPRRHLNKKKAEAD